jgi:hypothetical protein
MGHSNRLMRWAVIASAAIVAILLLTLRALCPDADRVESEQYAVYSAYIEPNLTGESHDLGDRSGLVVIQENTINRRGYGSLFSSTRHVKANIPQLRGSVLFELFITNLLDERLERRFHLSAKYELGTQQEINLYPFEQFTRRFPDSYGYLTFSRVAFNRDLTKAFFYTEHICGLCGEGKYVFMRKVNGNWVVERTASTWIS